MKELTNCPYCGGDFIIKEVECEGCKTRIKGNFRVNRFHMFNPEDLYFIETFLRNEGNIKLMEKDLGVSYPTVKGRLKNIVKMLGYESKNSDSEERLRILRELSDGEIDVKEAIRNLEKINDNNAK
ncbi:MAG TPA: DUF2089 domain-containing protein [Balneolaceae bacterium]|nr:DUF2089 domain-containing protein [Balneolaceae bacterium]